MRHPRSKTIKHRSRASKKRPQGRRLDSQRRNLKRKPSISTKSNLRSKTRTNPKSHPNSDPKLEKSYRLLRSGLSQRSAAKDAGVSIGRLRRFIRKNKLAKYQGRRWRFNDRRYREIRAITTEGEKTFFVRGFKAASTAMSHRNAVRNFLVTQDRSLLTPFEGVSVTDARGHIHKLEVRPNVLYRLASADSDQYIAVYRLVA